MFKEFQLAAISKENDQFALLQIRVNKKLHNDLANKWKLQYDSFIDQIEKIDYQPDYKLEQHERFYIQGYELPDWLATENYSSISDLQAVSDNELQMSRIKGVAAFVRNDSNDNLILFQRFYPSQVIRSNNNLFLDSGTFRRIDSSGLRLGGKLSAVYRSAEQKLLFQSYHNVNTFLPLSEYFRPASEADIRRILDHDLFLPEDLEASVMDFVNQQWFRTRFALLERSGILDDCTAINVELRAEACKIPIELSDDKEKIIFPSDKQEAKKLLQFLNQDVFRGPVTDELFETNSKKKSNPQA